MDLHTKRILITRPRSQADEFAAALQEAGAQPILFPVIQIAPVEDPASLDRALGRLACYDWLVLTSVNGVQAVWERLATLGIEAIPEKVRIAAIGPKTAEAVQDRGAKSHFVPEEYIAEAILPGLGDLRGRWVLLPRAELARPDLALAIRAAGGIPHEITAYRTLPANPDAEGLEALCSGVDVITFTSSSTVRNFAVLARGAGLNPQALPGSPLIACIGPITAATAREEGFNVDMIATQYTTAGLLRTLLEYVP